MTTTDPTLAALLAGVLATPDDDVPRLVLADCLDDLGDHAKAEFVRVQCELARLGAFAANWALYNGDSLPDDTAARLIALRRREQELRSRHQSTWFAQAIGRWVYPANLDYEFRRGFIESVTCDLGTFMGGPCGACGGAENWEEGDDDARDPCRVCDGDPNYRTPGIAPRLFASQPVLRVTLTDTDIVWQRSIDGKWTAGSGGPGPGPALPWEIWDIFTNLDGWPFDTRDAALDALSAALVAYGRANAEGMTHEAVCDLCGVHEWKQRHPGIDPGGLTAWCRCEGTGTVRRPGLPPLAERNMEQYVRPGVGGPPGEDKP